MQKSIAFKKLRSIFRNQKQDEVFSSQTFANAFTSLAKMVSNRFSLENPIVVKLVNKKSGEIAYTDNKNIVINLNNEITKKVNSLEEKYLTYLGMLGHECGHLLFTDFNILKKIQKSFFKKELYVKEPVFNSIELKNKFEKVKNKIFSDDFKALDEFIGLFYQIENIIEDKYVNVQIMNKFPGTFKSGIKKIYQLMFQIENNMGTLPLALISDFEYFINYIHKYLEFAEKEEAEEKYKEFKDEEFIAFLDSIHELHSVEERIQAVYIVIAYSADYLLALLDNVNELKNMLKNLKNSSTTTSIGEGTGECSITIVEPSENSSEENNSSSTAEGGKSNENKANNSSIANNNSTSSDKDNDSSDKKSEKSDSEKGEDKSPISISDILDGHIRSVLQHEPDKAKSEICQNRSLEVLGASDFFAPKIITPKKNKEKYNYILSELRPFIKRLKRGFEEIVDDRATGLRTRNLLSGTRVNPSATATSGGKVFMRNKLPEDIAEVAACILIDQSGSMYGTRMDMAKKTSIILSEFCESLNLPYMVLGHEYDGTCELFVYSDFDDRKDSKYSISTMQAGGCNRDGFALRYAAKALSERPEPSKLLFLISDGWPSAYNSRKEAEKDITSGIKFCKTNDILLSAMAIGEDKEQIKALYGDAFVDISDLSKLPKKVINNIKKYIS